MPHCAGFFFRGRAREVVPGSTEGLSSSTASTPSGSQTCAVSCPKRSARTRAVRCALPRSASGSSSSSPAASANEHSASTTLGLSVSSNGSTSRRTRVRRNRGDSFDGSFEQTSRCRSTWSRTSARLARNRGRISRPALGGMTARPRRPVPRTKRMSSVSARSSAV